MVKKIFAGLLGVLLLIYSIWIIKRSLLCAYDAFMMFYDDSIEYMINGTRPYTIDGIFHVLRAIFGFSTAVCGIAAFIKCKKKWLLSVIGMLDIADIAAYLLECFTGAFNSNPFSIWPEILIGMLMFLLAYLLENVNNDSGEAYKGKFFPFIKMLFDSFKR